MNKKIYRAAYCESSRPITKDDIECILEGEKVYEAWTEIITLPGPTRNGVMYPLDEFKKAVESPMVQDMLKRGSMYGEGGHPLDPKDINRWIAVPMDKAQFKWLEFKFEGNKFMGKFRTYDGNGNLLAKAINNGELPAFSIRVLGTESMEKGYRTLRNIILITIDWVNYPGNPTSFVNNTKEIELKDVPIIAYDHYADGRVIPRSESYTVLGLSDNQELLDLGNGYFTAIEKFNKDDRTKLRAVRENAF